MMTLDEIEAYTGSRYAQCSVMSYVNVGFPMDEAIAYAFHTRSDSELAAMLEVSESEANAVRDRAMERMDAYVETHVRRDVDMDDPSIWVDPTGEEIRRVKAERIANGTYDTPKPKPRLASRVRGTFSRK